PGVLRILERQAALTEGEEDAAAAHDDESAAADAACPGWQEAYYSLLLLEKVAAQAGAALAWPAPAAAAAGATAAAAKQQAPPAPQSAALWEGFVRLLLHRHVWVRKAAARLVGYGLAAPRVCGGLMAGRAGRAGQLAFAFFLQLECEEADEATCLQAVKCLVSLSVHLHREAPEGAAATNGTQHQKQQQQQGLASHKRLRTEPAAAAADGEEDEAEAVDEQEEEEEEGVDGEDAANGGGATAEEAEAEDAAEEGEGAEGAADAAAEDAEDDAGDAVSMAAQVRRRAFTLRGLVRRMARLADDGRWTRSRQRAAALRWTAAAASALGPEAVAPHLPVLLRPLFRISEAAAAPGGTSRVAEDVRLLAEEVMAHLRGLVGSEVLLGAYNAAREHVRGLRAERKRRAAVRGMLDPAAAAAARLRHNARKAEGRKRKMELMKRERGAGRRQGGRGGGKGARRA
ncbi:hypothetical protein Agub_g15132, partial [Astrephomene gubernaculifera]